MAADEVGAALRHGRLRERVVGCTEHADEQLDRRHLAGAAIDDVQLHPRVVDEGLVARAVIQAHRQAPPAEPRPVQLAELRVAVPIRVLLEVLDVQQRQRHARSLAFSMEVREVRHGPRRAGRFLGAVHDALQLVVGQRHHGVPRQRGLVRLSNDLADAADADIEALRDLAVATIQRPFLAQYLSNVSHGQSWGRHVVSGSGASTRHGTMPIPAFTTPIPAFTMPIPAFTMPI